MRSYRRVRIAGGSYFFTVNLAERRGNDLLLRQVDALRDAGFSIRWALIKQGFSRVVPAGEWLSESRLRKGERGIWQRRYWEHAIRDDNDYRRHMDYIHYNLVKHGYVQRAVDWPYSSLPRMVDAGLYPQDWCAAPEISTADYE